jgi:hypothetical protein
VIEGQQQRLRESFRAPPQELERSVAASAGTRYLDWVAGGVTVGLYLVGQLLFLQGPHPFDPAWYFRAGIDFPDITADLFTLRIGLVALVHLAVLALGPSEAALYAVPLVSGVLLVGTVFATMLLLFRDRVVAGAAALVTGLNVSYLVNSSHIFPDITATATFSAAFLCLLLAGREALDEDRELKIRPLTPTILVACAGILLGWSYLVREFSPILLPVVIAVVVMLRFPPRRVLLLAATALATVTLEPIAGFVGGGEPFVRARLLLSRGDLAIDPGLERRMTAVQDRLDNATDTLVVFPRLLLAWSSGWSFLVLAVLFLGSLALFRDRRLVLLGIWFGSFFLVMAALGLGSLSSGRWILNVTNIRYWYPIFPPLVMGAFGGLWLLARSRLDGIRGVRLGQVAAVSVASVALFPGFVEFSSCSQQQAWRNDPTARWDELRTWLATSEAARFQTVWTDLHTDRLLPAYTSSTFGTTVWEGDTRTLGLTVGVPADRQASSLILVHKDRWGRSAAERRALRRLRGDWTPVFVTSDARMVVLAHETAVSPARAVPRAEGWWQVSTSFVPQADPGTCGRTPYAPEGAR